MAGKGWQRQWNCETAPRGEGTNPSWLQTRCPLKPPACRSTVLQGRSHAGPFGGNGRIGLPEPLGLGNIGKAHQNVPECGVFASRPAHPLPKFSQKRIDRVPQQIPLWGIGLLSGAAVSRMAGIEEGVSFSLPQEPVWCLRIPSVARIRPLMLWQFNGQFQIPILHS